MACKWPAKVEYVLKIKLPVLVPIAALSISFRLKETKAFVTEWKLIGHFDNLEAITVFATLYSNDVHRSLI